MLSTCCLINDRNSNTHAQLMSAVSHVLKRKYNFPLKPSAICAELVPTDISGSLHSCSSYSESYRVFPYVIKGDVVILDIVPGTLALGL